MPMQNINRPNTGSSVQKPLAKPTLIDIWIIPALPGLVERRLDIFKKHENQKQEVKR